MTAEQIRLPADALQGWAATTLRALGAPDSTAELVASSLVEADLRGHDSHGVRRLAPYADAIAEGRLDPAATPSVVAGGKPAAVSVDGANAFGQLTARLGAETAAERAAEVGISVAVLRRCQHVGRLGEYAEQIAAAGLIGFGFAAADPTVAPWGSRARMFGTNPIAWAVPTADGAAPVVVDFATSATAEGKLAVSRARGESIPQGLVIDSSGAPSTVPDDFYAGGALLPFGAHKGSGLGLIGDVVAGLLSGAGSASSSRYDGTFGTVLIAIDVDTFIDRAQFADEVEALRERLHDAPAAEGASGALMPGEPEWRTRVDRLRDGIVVAPGTVDALDALATRSSVPTLTDLFQTEESSS